MINESRSGSSPGKCVMIMGSNNDSRGKYVMINESKCESRRNCVMISESNSEPRGNCVMIWDRTQEGRYTKAKHTPVLVSQGCAAWSSPSSILWRILASKEKIYSRLKQQQLAERIDTRGNFCPVEPFCRSYDLRFTNVQVNDRKATRECPQKKLSTKIIACSQLPSQQQQTTAEIVGTTLNDTQAASGNSSAEDKFSVSHVNCSSMLRHQGSSLAGRRIITSQWSLSCGARPIIRHSQRCLRPPSDA
ncbi:hypothetical protein RRG08_025607 [Elysia crispata]|uniref:Uncharacterized protein n=1 Tax=Elysia crispata TaxID=231223 RepID=A0AAE0YEJ2_9GAST|nr:hypothetical protein RRG08_025607 [Elysia crispata]